MIYGSLLFLLAAIENRAKLTLLCMGLWALLFVAFLCVF